MNHSIKPGQVWLDTDGNRIQAHGGSILAVGGYLLLVWRKQGEDDR